MGFLGEPYPLVASFMGATARLLNWVKCEYEVGLVIIVVTKDAAEAFERRVAAYLEMHPVIIVAALNEHYKSRPAFNQTKFFDLRCLTEALRRSSIDASEFLPEEGRISMTMGALSPPTDWPASGPFRPENSQSGWKIVLGE